MKKIHCLNPIAKCGTELFPAGYEMTDKAADADAVLVRSASMHDMELPENLLAVGRAGAGVNNIPLDSCAQKGIVVFNTPGANANGVKELVIAGMLMASRDIVGGIEWCKANAEDDNITKDTEKSTHLGMEVYGYDPYISINAAWRLSRNVKHITNADIIFQKCDYITIHVPLMDSTRGMINKEKLAIMKDGVVILNFSRDTLVNDDDMAAALDAGKVRYYVSDFPNPKVANMERVILLPHLGASTKESEDNCAVMAASELIDYIENGNIRNSVNFPNAEMNAAGTKICVLHKNVPAVISEITTILGKASINIDNMINASKKDYAYTLIDAAGNISEDIAAKLSAAENVIKVRVIK